VSRARLRALLAALAADPRDTKTWRKVGLVFDAYYRQPAHSAGDMVTIEVWFQGEVSRVYRRLLANHPLPADVRALLPPLTEEEELEDRELAADDRRRRGRDRHVELQGRVIQRFRDWAVTTVGVECLVASYRIDASALGEPGSNLPATAWEER
jgi:hypothetical protein